jgi:hypothetical protein
MATIAENSTRFSLQQAAEGDGADNRGGTSHIPTPPEFLFLGVN